jgi:type II secretory pathway pseudopilin PulG
MTNHKAFTMMELIFILVIIGILAAVIIPKTQSSRLREAADQIVSHIRYTQHLAMMNDVFDPNNNEWYKERWQIVFSSSKDTENKYAYTIFSDKNNDGNPNVLSEIAKNPQDTSRLLSGGYSGTLLSNNKKATKEMHIGKKYGISKVEFSSACSRGSRRLAFDYLGRPLRGSIESLSMPYDIDHSIISQCTITITNDAHESINITVEPETGFARTGNVISP